MSMSLAQQEKKANAHQDFGPFRWPLALSAVLFAIGLVLPHAGTVRGWHLLAQQVGGSQLGLAEYVFTYLGTAAVVVAGGLLVMTRRAIFAVVAFLLSGMALMSSLLGMWMRLQDKEIRGGAGLGAGFILEVIVVVVFLYLICRIILRRGAEQQALAQARLEDDSLDEVAFAQRSAMVAKQQTSPDTNPLFVDNRRREARARQDRG